MAVSSDVVANNQILATDYNKLREDVLDNTTGHDHKGTDGKLLQKEALRWANAKLLLGAGVGAGDVPTEIDVPAADYPMKLEPDLTRWVVPGWFSGASVTRAMVANRIYYTPIFVAKDTTYIRIGIYVATLDAGNADLRIFNFANGLPTSLVLSAGTVDTGTTGAKEINIDELLTRGYYFLAVRFTGTPTCKSLSTTRTPKPPVAGFSESLDPTLAQVIMTADAVYADPAPAPDDIWSANYSTVLLREN